MRNRSFPGFSFLISILFVFVLSGCSSEDSPVDPGGGGGPGVWYVDAGATGAGDGTSWDDAFEHPSEAMAAASTGDQIWVAMGTYFGPGDRSEPVVAFKPGVKMYGGFDGGETDLSQRDISSRALFNGGDSLFSVVTGAQEALLHGFLIAGGNADGTATDAERFGGGIICLDAEMRISHCLIYENSAGGGGGIYAEGGTVTVDSCRIVSNESTEDGYNSSGGGGLSVISGGLVMADCEVEGNSAADKAGGILLYNSSATVDRTVFSLNSVSGAYRNGGGIVIDNSQTQAIVPEFRGCGFDYNSAGYGGAVFINNSSPLFSDCEFEENAASMTGSAINTMNSSYRLENCVLSDNERTAVYNFNPLGAGVPTIFNCLFTGNGSNSTIGGAIVNNAVSAEIEFCTITGNMATSGGGIYSSGSCYPVVRDCIIWDNSATTGDPQVHDAGAAATTVTYTDIDQDGFEGAGLFNLRSDPLFVTGPRGDHYLSQTAAGQGSDSPCIDAGSNTSVYYLLHMLTTMTSSAVDAGQADIGFHYDPED